jgi:RHS repeat-associated protein
VGVPYFATKGQRVIKILTDANGKVTTTHYHFNQQGLLIAETRDNGQPLVEYIYLNKQRVASLRYQGTEHSLDFVHNDHLGSPMLQTNGEAEIIWRNQALPFGQEYQASITEQGFGFPGQYQDVESGYSYNYFRDYDASLGRYIQSDPIGLVGGLNTYGYVTGNPVIAVDFWGVDVTYVGKGFIGGGGRLWLCRCTITLASTNTAIYLRHVLYF